TVKVVRPAVAPDAGVPATVAPDVTFEASTDATAGKVAACLTGKIKALALKPPQGQSISLPYTFRFVHSGIADALPDATPEIQLIQIDLQRGRRTADVAIAEGNRTLAAAVYEDVVKRFKAHAKPEPSIVELKGKCAALLAADDKLIAT